MPLKNTSVVFQNGQYQYIGRVLSYSDDRQSVLVEYDKTYDDRENGRRTKQCVPVSFVKKRNIKNPNQLVAGQCVEFLSRERGIQFGCVNGAYTYNADITYYGVDKDGYVYSVEEKAVGFARIIEASQMRGDMRYIPFKDGDKVKIEDDSDYVVGTVVGAPSSAGEVSILIVEYGAKNAQSTRTIKCHFSRLCKVTTPEGLLRRSDFITDLQQQDIDYNANIKKQIQQQELRMPTANYVEPAKPLFRHQLAGCELAEKYNRFAFFYDTGTGKTAMALSIIANKHKQYGAKFLIIAPKSIIKTAWLDDQKDFFPDMRILPLDKDFNHAKQKALLQEWRESPNYPIQGKLKPRANYEMIRNELEQNAQHYIINPEFFIKKPMYYIENFGITGLIVDESAILKDYHGKTPKCIRESAKGLKYVYLLSGNPAPNNEIEYFSQMKIVAPDAFFMSYSTFVNLFCQRDSNRWILKPCNQELFADEVASRSLTITKEDCLDLPPALKEIRQVTLPDECKKLYQRLLRAYLAAIKWENDFFAEYSSKDYLTQLMKLRQIASGFIMFGKQQKRTMDLHQKKIDELLAVLAEIPSKQVIIWCQFRHEIQVLERELSKYGTVVTAYGDTGDIDKSIDDFKSGKAKYILALPKTLKYGVTFTNCQYAVYYSLSFSAEEYDQSHDRNYRLGQTKPCTYIHLQAAETIDEEIYEKVMKKLSNAKFFEQLIKHAAKHGIDYATLKPKSKEETKKEMKRILIEAGCKWDEDTDFEE